MSAPANSGSNALISTLTREPLATLPFSTLQILSSSNITPLGSSPSVCRMFLNHSHAADSANVCEVKLKANEPCNNFQLLRIVIERDWNHCSAYPSRNVLRCAAFCTSVQLFNAASCLYSFIHSVASLSAVPLNLYNCPIHSFSPSTNCCCCGLDCVAKGVFTIGVGEV